jgi:glycosyltransferase involved in cell wall biosynthesis
MKILFIHQNFPGQFRHLAAELAKQQHTVYALAQKKNGVREALPGVRIFEYSPRRGNTPSIHPWLVDFESQTIRAECVYRLALDLKRGGFTPDIIYGHPGWGECLLIKEVWPTAAVGLYFEYYYRSKDGDSDFDPEFKIDIEELVPRIRWKNIANELCFELADFGVSPTQWQRDTFPEKIREKISVIHDGIDTDTVKPNSAIEVSLNGKNKLTKCDEVITFVSRTLEPHRGFHIFMRSLPHLLKTRPNANVLIIGSDGVSYGKPPTSGQTWRQQLLREIQPLLDTADLSRISFLGQLPYSHFISILQLSTIHVYLTYPFVISWSLLEAMACGCAIVASDTPPVKEILTDRYNANLVSFFDQSQLVNRVDHLLSSEVERATMVSIARKTAMERYDLKTSCLPKQIDLLKNYSH